MTAALALAASTALLAAPIAERPACRCLPSDASCWPAAAEWAALNASVSGRLHASVDELDACLGPTGEEIKSDACWGQLNQTDDEFWLADQPNGYQHTGLWGSEHGAPGPENEGRSWNTSVLSAYVVHAEAESDFQATVRFAAQHNLRLVVKATGHDWYGRSCKCKDTTESRVILWPVSVISFAHRRAGLAGPVDAQAEADDLARRLRRRRLGRAGRARRHRGVGRAIL